MPLCLGRLAQGGDGSWTALWSLRGDLITVMVAERNLSWGKRLHLTRRAAERRRTAENGRLLAGYALPVRRNDLFAQQPTLEGAAQDRAHQESALGPLGLRPGTDLHVGAP